MVAMGGGTRELGGAGRALVTREFDLAQAVLIVSKLLAGKA
jgi:hypothetical protein